MSELYIIKDNLEEWGSTLVESEFYYLRNLRDLLNKYYNTPTGYFRNDEDPILCFDGVNTYFIINDLNQILFVSNGDLWLCNNPIIHHGAVEFIDIDSNINLSELKGD